MSYVELQNELNRLAILKKDFRGDLMLKNLKKKNFKKHTLIWIFLTYNEQFALGKNA